MSQPADETGSPPPEHSEQGGNGLAPKPGSASRVSWLTLTKAQWSGLAMLLVSFGIAVVISHQSKQHSLPNVSKEPGPPTTAGVRGFPEAVEVGENLARARQLTPRAALIGISVTTAAGGAVSVKEGAVVRYHFRSEAGEGPEPPRPFGTLARRHYCGRQSVQINEAGIAALTDDPRAACERVAKALPAPACAFRDVLVEAGKHGLRLEQPVSAEYYNSAAGPAWRLHSEGGTETLAVAADCSKLLTPDDAVRSVQ